MKIFEIDEKKCNLKIVKKNDDVLCIYIKERKVELNYDVNTKEFEAVLIEFIKQYGKNFKFCCPNKCLTGYIHQPTTIDSVYYNFVIARTDPRVRVVNSFFYSKQLLDIINFVKECSLSGKN